MKYLFLIFSSIIFAQQTKSVDFESVFGRIAINPNEKSITGSVKFLLTVLKSVDTLRIDAQNMIFSKVALNKKEIKFTTNGKQLLLIHPFGKGKNILTLDYKALPKQTLYFVGSEKTNNLQIWTQGQGKYTSHWFPSFDDVNEKMIFNLEVVFDSKYEVISNGILQNKLNRGNLTHWKFKMQKPMSSYLLMLAIGQFDKKREIAKSGIPLEMYYEPKTISNFEPTYRYSKQIFDFLEKEIGVKYPWEIYKQIPVRDFLYAGMENTSATLFMNRFVVDSIGFQDRNYVNVNAHELAHQWFGNLVTAHEGKHHWLQEGFATYYALLAEKEIFGEDYFYSELNNYGKQIYQASKSDTIPVLNAKASSLSFYKKGALALHVLRSEIGEIAFKKAVKNYLTKHSFQTVDTQDFFSEIKKVSNYDLNNFSKVWLESSEYNRQTVNNLLAVNSSIQSVFEIEKLRTQPLANKIVLFTKILQSDAHHSVKEAILFQLSSEKFENKKQLLLSAMETKDWQVRQAVAISLNTIPEEFRMIYETLLDDKSYETQEIALYKLWQDFPNLQIKYLEKSKNWIGYNDCNLRILWLYLAIAAKEYSADKSSLIEELKQYASIDFEAPTRKEALEKLLELDIIDAIVLKNLVNATTHHHWQFSKFGRDYIRILLKKDKMKTSFENILPQLNESERLQLERLLKE